jgi:hypothetical protein
MNAAADKARAERRERERTKRDRNRRIRRLALTLFSDMAERDPTVSGATFISPSGKSEFISADILRRGGRA